MTVHTLGDPEIVEITGLIPTGPVSRPGETSAVVAAAEVAGELADPRLMS